MAHLQVAATSHVSEAFKMPSEKLATDGECVVSRRSASTPPPPPLTSDVYQSPCYDNDSAEGTAVESAIEFAWCAPGRRQRRQRPSTLHPNQRLWTLPSQRGTRASGGLVFLPSSHHAALPAPAPAGPTRRPSSRRPHLLQPVAWDSATSLGSSFSGLALPAICVRVRLLGQAISNLQTPKDQSSYQCGRHLSVFFAAARGRLRTRRPAWPVGRVAASAVATSTHFVSAGTCSTVRRLASGARLGTGHGGMGGCA